MKYNLSDLFFTVAAGFYVVSAILAILCAFIKSPILIILAGATLIISLGFTFLGERYDS